MQPFSLFGWLPPSPQDGLDMADQNITSYLPKSNSLPNPASFKWLTSPLPLQVRKFLDGLFDSKCLIEEITSQHILLRLVNRIYFIQHSKTKSEFINDPEIRKLFGTNDKNLLEEYYDFIRYNKDSQELDKYSSIQDFISDPTANFIKGSELDSTQGEAAEKFTIHLLEKIYASYLMMNGFLQESPLSSSLFLNDWFPLSVRHAEQLGITPCDPILTERKFWDSTNNIRFQSIDINSITSGTDRLSLILPITPENGTLTISGLTLLNTVTEYKMKLSDKIDRRAFLTRAHKIVKGNENDRLILGKMEDYPPPLRSKTDRRVVVEGIGLGRIDRLGRDWYKLKTSLGINSLFKRGTKELDTKNCLEMATDEFRKALAVNIPKPTSLDDTHAINRIIVGITGKMENSVAQHQLIEFMRSGRWFAPKNLGIGFSPIKSSVDALKRGLMTQRSYADLPNVGLGEAIDPDTAILIPLLTPNGRQYNGIIERDTFFHVQQLNHSEFRFGITKHLDMRGIVQRIPNSDLFSIRVPRPTGRLHTIRKYQRKVYELLFLTPHQGHHTNLILGMWMPEVSILTYAGATQYEVLKLLEMTRKDYPITYNYFQTFDMSFLKLKWVNGPSIPQRNKIIDIEIPQPKNPVTLHKNGDQLTFVQTDLFETTARKVKGTEYINNYVPIKGITTYETLFSKTKLHSQSPKCLDMNRILLALGKLPLAHRSSSNLGLPSPLGGLTVEPYAGQEPPIQLLELVEATLNTRTLLFLPFRPPTKVFKDDRLLMNDRLEPKTTALLLKKLGNKTKVGYFLGSYFNEIKNYLDHSAISDLLANAPSVEQGMIDQLTQVANKVTSNLIELPFKKEFEHLKPVFFWFDPKKHHSPKEDHYTIMDLRILPGHFPMYPANIDPEFRYTRPFKLKRSYGNERIFPNAKAYNKTMHLWIEAQLRRILNRLTLNQHLLSQNLQNWKQAMVTNAVTKRTMQDIFSETQLIEIAKRYLAPKSTIVYDINSHRMTIKAFPDRIFKHGAFLTPIFLSKKYLKNDDALKAQRNIISKAIDEIPKNIQNKKEIIAYFKHTNIPFRISRILFQ